RLARQATTEERKGVGSLADRLLAELAALEEGGGDRHAQDRQSDGGGDEHEDVEPQRERGAMPNRVDGADGRISRQERKEDEGQRLREGAQRQLRDRV